MAGKTFIVQGFGNVGFWASKFLTEWGGARCVGIAEYNSAIYNEEGFNIEDVNNYKIVSTTLAKLARFQMLSMS